MFKNIFYLLIFAILFICISGNPTWARKPIDEEKDILKKVKIIRVVVEEYYGIAGNVRLPFFDYSEKILRYAGFEVVRETSGYDAILQIRAKVTRESAFYSIIVDKGGWRSGNLYTGALAEGELSFEIGDRKFFSLQFFYRVDPPRSITTLVSSEYYSNPQNAPLREAFNNSFLPEMLEMLAKMKGPEPLIAALKDEDSFVRKSAAKSLEKISGQNFGEDPVKWQEWWEKNKGKYK